MIDDADGEKGDNDNDDLAIHLAIHPSSPPILSLNFKAYHKKYNVFWHFFSLVKSQFFFSTRLNVKLPPKPSRLDGEVSVSQESLQSERIMVA